MDQQLNSEQFKRYLDSGDFDKDVKKQMESQTDGITDATPQSQKIFLSRCLAKMNPGVHREFLALKIGGATNTQLAYKYKVPVNIVRKMENEAILRMKDALSKGNGGNSGLIWTPPSS